MFGEITLKLGLAPLRIIDPIALILAESKEVSKTLRHDMVYDDTQGHTAERALFKKISTVGATI